MGNGDNQIHCISRKSTSFQIFYRYGYLYTALLLAGCTSTLSGSPVARVSGGQACKLPMIQHPSYDPTAHRSQQSLSYRYQAQNRAETSIVIWSCNIQVSGGGKVNCSAGQFGLLEPLVHFSPTLQIKYKAQQNCYRGCYGSHCDSNTHALSPAQPSSRSTSGICREYNVVHCRYVI